MKLVKKGAEGDIYIINWHNNNSILKIRKKKSYRNNLLDSAIRKHRTITESEILCTIKSFGIYSPLLYFVDVKNSIIIMQYIDGYLVRDLPDEKLIQYCKIIGDIVGKLHMNGIMHGDLTTSNFIVKNDIVYAIDFGLAAKTTKITDHAIDLRLFKEILNSAHTTIAKKSWENFLDGYKKIVTDVYYTNILHHLSIIENRGRYTSIN